jgi:subtilisin family serine protease
MQYDKIDNSYICWVHCFVKVIYFLWLTSLGPIPKKWKGVWADSGNFSCNNKIIGAQSYNVKEESARDYGGHGTHTAPTTSGREVNDINFYEFHLQGPLYTKYATRMVIVVERIF